MNSNTELHYTNRMGRFLLQGMEEILGREGMNAVLLRSGLSEYIEHLPADDLELKVPFSHVSRLQVSLEEEYGKRAGQGVAIRIGRAGFKYGLREFGSILGITNPAFKMLPIPARVLRLSEALAELFNKFTDQQVNLEHNNEQISWHIERCAYCWERQADEPVCFLAVGLLQEALDWACSGRQFEVRETGCRATGDETCTIVIKQRPVS